MSIVTKSNIDTSSIVSETSLYSKSTSESYKSNNDTTYKSKDFKTVLNSKSNDDNKNIQKADDTESSTEVKDSIAVKEPTKDSTEVKDSDKDSTEVDKLKDELKKLEEDSKSDSKDKVTDILTELLSLLNKINGNENQKTLNTESNSELLKAITQEINGAKNSDNNLNSLMAKLAELLKTDSSKEKLDTDSLKSMEKILSNLSSNLANNNTENAKEIKSGIKDLMSEISNMQNTKQSQKVLTLEEMLNQNYSHDNKEDSLKQDSSNTSSSNSNKEASKEDKFLNSLANDNKDTSLDKINLFASRTQITQQSQSVSTTEQLTVNKTTLANDLIKDVKFMTANSIKELTVKVNPGNLGEITIKLIQEDGITKANLKANSKETEALLSQNLANIKNHLDEQNIKIDDVSVEVYKEDTTLYSNQKDNGGFSGNEQNKNTNNKKVELGTDTSTIENIEDTDNVNYLA